MRHERTETARIIVAFGDFSHFTSFEESVTNPETEFDPLFEDFDDFIDATEKRTGYSFTDTGDGFMCTVDLAQGHGCGVASKVLEDLWRTLIRIQKFIRDKEPPRPTGFRIRIATGYVRRKVKHNGTVVLRGRHINLAHHLLDVGRTHSFLVHDSVKQLLNPVQIRRCGFSFKKFEPSESDLTKVSPLNARSLWIFKVAKRRRRGVA